MKNYGWRITNPHYGWRITNPHYGMNANVDHASEGIISPTLVIKPEKVQALTIYLPDGRMMRKELVEDKRPFGFNQE